jgi:DNA-binding PadR family transcriptional regulator
LDRLVRKGFLTTIQGDPTPERGGMSKRFYNMTKKGIKVLNESKKVYDSMWSEIDDRATIKG